MQFLAKFKAISNREEWPLNIDERRQLAKLERELADLQKKLAPEPDEEAAGNGKAPSADVVLDESLRLLAEFISLKKPDAVAAPEVALPPREKGGFLESLKRWLRNLI